MCNIYIYIIELSTKQVPWWEKPWAFWIGAWHQQYQKSINFINFINFIIIFDIKSFFSYKSIHSSTRATTLPSTFAQKCEVLHFRWLFWLPGNGRWPGPSPSLLGDRHLWQVMAILQEDQGQCSAMFTETIPCPSIYTTALGIHLSCLA